MDFQVPFIITAVVLAGVIVFAVFLWRDRDKYLFKCKPLMRDRDKLQEEVDRLRRLAGTDYSVETEKTSKKTDKSSENRHENNTQKVEKTAEVSELNEKIRTLKNDIARVREENYNLKKDNKELRRDMRDNSEANQGDQREIVSLREQNAGLEAEIKSLRQQIHDSEKSAVGESDVQTQTAASVVSKAEDIEKIAALERDRESLSATVRDLRGEISSMKRDFRSEVDAAKKEAADSNHALRKDLNRARRLVDQSKKRADNNHKVYLMARAQMILAEKRLAAFDPEYKPVVALPTGNDAIDEIIKKFNTIDARENRASANVIQQEKEIGELKEQIKELKSEVDSAKSVKSEALSFSSFDKSLEMPDDSLSALVGSISSSINSIKSDKPVLSGLDAGKLGDLDFSSMGDWESI